MKLAKVFFIALTSAYLTSAALATTIRNSDYGQNPSSVTASINVIGGNANTQTLCPSNFSPCDQNDTLYVVQFLNLAGDGSIMFDGFSSADMNNAQFAAGEVFQVPSGTCTNTSTILGTSGAAFDTDCFSFTPPSNLTLADPVFDKTAGTVTLGYRGAITSQDLTFFVFDPQGRPDVTVTPSSGGSSTVPEPSIALMLISGVVLVGKRQLRRKTA